MTVRILHTSDWHLGKRLGDFSRDPEQIEFLNWLTETIINEEIDVLVVAGDIFDIKNPGPASRAVYYRFLSQLSKTKVQHTVIVGGNHDSASVLDAPSEILQALHISVVGGATDNVEDEVLTIRNRNNDPILVVGAVPFLRDADIRSGASLTDEDSISRELVEGINRHYSQIIDHGRNLADQYKIPFMLTGHLFCLGSTLTESTRNIHIGNLGAVPLEVFQPERIEYAALGHLHRIQKVGGSDKVRYSGSPLPFSFSESNKKSVIKAELDYENLRTTQEIEIPEFSLLETIQGDLNEVKSQIEAISLPEKVQNFYLALELKEDLGQEALESLRQCVDQHEYHERLKLVKIQTPDHRFKHEEQGEGFTEIDISYESIFKQLIKSFSWESEQDQIMLRLEQAVEKTNGKGE